MGKPKQESGDAEMAAINKQRDDMVRAGMIEGIGRENYDIIMDIHSVKGKPCLLYTSDAADE